MNTTKISTGRAFNVLQMYIMMFVADGSLRKRKYHFTICWPVLIKREAPNFVTEPP